MTTNELGNFEVWKVTKWHRCTGQDRRRGEKRRWWEWEMIKTKQRGNLESNCGALKFPTSNTRDGSVPQVDYVRLALPWQPVQCAFQVEFLNFYINVHNIWEGTFAFSIFTICGGIFFNSLTLSLSGWGRQSGSCPSWTPPAVRPLPYSAEDSASCLNMTSQMNEEGR